MKHKFVGLAPTGVALAIAAGISWSSPVKADPPPEPNVPVFCFRVTDILNVAGDADRFQFEFEILNWTNQPAHGMDLSLTQRNFSIFGPTVDNAPFIAGAAVDVLGRPIGPLNDDANFAAVANSPGFLNGVGAKVGQLNNWVVTNQTASQVKWRDPSPPNNPLHNRDLLNPSLSLAQKLALVPGAVLDIGGNPIVPDFETVDNGAPGVTGPGANGVDNVLDGFVIDLDDFDPGESVSFNWLLTDAAGNVIQQNPNRPNAMALGVLNIYRPMVDENGPGLWCFLPDSGFSGGNTGSTANIRDIFPDADNPAFRVEFGPQMTAPFLLATDNSFDLPVNVHACPEPGTLALSGIALVGLLLRKRWRGSAC
jgi:hypothetical protein